ncbi:MAG TPA: hypothetical protein ENN29_09590 [Candidatus Hydrogenedentes bacterium]|nr:hypothetical protein [Candidatus Hydrogenedentota bacterium]
MPDTREKMVPDWVWAALAIAVVSVALALFVTDSPERPGDALVYDVSEYEAVDAEDIRYRETLRVALELENPAALAVDNNGHILIAGEGALLVLDEAGGELARREIEGRPYCAAVAPDGVIYLGMRDHVAACSPEGDVLAAWDMLNERAWLTSIVADENHVFVADSGNARVYVYDHSGTRHTVIGERDPEQGLHGFVVPSHYFEVALDTTGALWATNPGKLGLEKYREDGALLGAWHQPGFDIDKFPGCCNPVHIAFKSDGALVAAEKGINRVKVFAADRSFEGVVAAPELLNAGWKTADFPDDMTPVRDIAVDGNDRVLVLHGPLRSLLIFEHINK